MAQKEYDQTILVVDDNGDARELLVLVLQQEGYMVFTAQNGKEALEKLEKFSVQIVVSDVMMPAMYGFELVQRIRENPSLQHVYVILITANNQTEGLIHGLDSGADDYIGKPVILSEFLARVRVGTRHVQHRENLQQQALVDTLTGLFNRGAFEKKITEEFERAKRYRRPLSIIIIDIDDFKKINDSYGHHCGDEVLKTMAKNLGYKRRQSDLCARYGGDEFVLVLPETRLENALQAIDRICKGVKDSTFGPVRLTVSIGVASTSAKEYSDWRDMLVEADEALYDAKSRGKGRASFRVTTGGLSCPTP